MWHGSSRRDRWNAAPPPASRGCGVNTVNGPWQAWQPDYPDRRCRASAGGPTAAITRAGVCRRTRDENEKMPGDPMGSTNSRGGSESGTSPGSQRRHPNSKPKTWRRLGTGVRPGRCRSSRRLGNAVAIIEFGQPEARAGRQACCRLRRGVDRDARTMCRREAVSGMRDRGGS